MKYILLLVIGLIILSGCVNSQNFSPAESFHFEYDSYHPDRFIANNFQIDENGRMVLTKFNFYSIDSPFGLEKGLAQLTEAGEKDFLLFLANIQFNKLPDTLKGDQGKCPIKHIETNKKKIDVTGCYNDDSVKNIEEKIKNMSKLFDPVSDNPDIFLSYTKINKSTMNGNEIIILKDGQIVKREIEKYFTIKNVVFGKELNQNILNEIDSFILQSAINDTENFIIGLEPDCIGESISINGQLRRKVTLLDCAEDDSFAQIKNKLLETASS